MAKDHDAYAALRFRDYRCLLSGSILAALGAEVLHVAVSWELYLRTNSASILGYAGLVQFLPILLLALPAGAIADRFNRKHLCQLAQATWMLIAGSLVYLSHTEGPVWLILCLLLVAGIARAFNAPARVALLPQVVPLELLPNAITWNSTGWQIANISGPALGGIILGLANPLSAYCFSAICFFSCILLLVPIRPMQRGQRESDRSLSALFAGVRFVWHTKPLFAALTLDLFAVLFGGATALLPIFARDILKVGPSGLGWLRAAPAVGALAMALLLAHLPPLRQPGKMLLVAVAGFGLATIGFGLSTSFWLSLLLLGLLGAMDNISVVVRGTLMQVLTPNEMRGRVAAVNTVFISSSNELGAFESGMTAHWFGPILSVVGGGVGTLIVAFLVLRSFPVLWTLGPLHTLTPETFSSQRNQSGKTVAEAV